MTFDYSNSKFGNGEFSIRSMALLSTESVDSGLNHLLPQIAKSIADIQPALKQIDFLKHNLDIPLAYSPLIKSSFRTFFQKVDPVLDKIEVLFSEAAESVDLDVSFELSIGSEKNVYIKVKRIEMPNGDYPISKKKQYWPSLIKDAYKQYKIKVGMDKDRDILNDYRIHFNLDG